MVEMNDGVVGIVELKIVGSARKGIEKEFAY